MRAIIRIPCVVCSRLFTTRQVKRSINAATGVCFDCYAQGVRTKSWCIGDKSEYDSESAECSMLCPDKAVCRLLIQGRIQL